MKRIKSYIGKSTALCLISVALFFACNTDQEENLIQASKSPVDYVDPFIGTGGKIGEGHGNVFPGATFPFGMIQLSPDHGEEGWEYCSGYHYPDSIIAGFSHTHLSGTGVGDLADISLMPTTKMISEEAFVQSEEFVKALGVKRGINYNGLYPQGGTLKKFKGNHLLNYASRFTHKEEKAVPGYYAVHLLDDDIDVELSVTEFVGFHRYTFNSSGERQHLILDLGFHINRDKPVDTYFEMPDSQTVTGYRFSTGWAKNQKVFFAIRFSKPIVKTQAFVAKVLEVKEYGKGVDVKGVFSFKGRDQNTLMAKVAVSSASVEGALANLNTAEPFEWDFDKVKKYSNDRWNDELGKIKVISNNEEQKKTFYTSLYRCYIAPNRFSDIDGTYKGYNHEPVKAVGYTHYTILSLWDTFRALKPLFAILQPDLYQNIIHSMLAQYKQTGSLPYWEIMGNEGGSMIGYHAVSLIADAILKNIGTYDVGLAYEAMVVASETNRKGLDYYREYHFVPTDKEKSGTVSKTVEYSYNDWCIAQVARALGKTDDYEKYMSRAEYYKNLYDPQYKLMRGKNSDGTWYEPFDPRYATYGNPHCVEGNTWHYSFFVPQDIGGLEALLGGPEDFEMMLDSLFLQSSELSGEDTEDVTGLIGQYAHGNEPSHHVAYLFDFVDQPHKTQYWTNLIMDSLYQNTPEGLCGNEDCGQMSAWYVFSAMGFYPVNPIDGKYYIGSPQFEEVHMELPNGNTFHVIANGVSDDHIFIKSAHLNGEAIKRNYITYDEIMKGGKLELTMSDRGYRQPEAIL